MQYGMVPKFVPAMLKRQRQDSCTSKDGSISKSWNRQCLGSEKANSRFDGLPRSTSEAEQLYRRDSWFLAKQPTAIYFHEQFWTMKLEPGWTSWVILAPVIQVKTMLEKMNSINVGMNGVEVPAVLAGSGIAA